jgi:hypothetical protein
MTKILFIGESWQGSSARSLREALAALNGIEIADIAEDHVFPKYVHLALRIANRLLRPLQSVELRRAVHLAVEGFQPDVIVVYKGASVDVGLLSSIRQAGVPVVNVFPDCSPHAHGRNLMKAMGEYDLVISTKSFHPAIWNTIYGYANQCVCIPHGFDPNVHLWPGPELAPTYDLAMCASWRPEYHRLMRSLAQVLGTTPISVAIAGPGWSSRKNEFPASWQFVGVRTGRAYGDFLRGAKIVLAPVNREVVIDGVRQPGDEDTTRTYELASAYCFFIHQRTDFVATVYDEKTEVPFWEDANDILSLLHRWLPDEEGRRAMAARAHARAVPAYSIPSRATSILLEIEKLIRERPVQQVKG